MNRRGFLQAMLVAGAAPAIVRASSLMKVISPSGIVGFDLAGVNTERTIIIASPSARLSNLLWPGVKEWWGKSYVADDRFYTTE